MIHLRCTSQRHHPSTALPLDAFHKPAFGGHNMTTCTFRKQHRTPVVHDTLCVCERTASCCRPAPAARVKMRLSILALTAATAAICAPSVHAWGKSNDDCVGDPDCPKGEWCAPLYTRRAPPRHARHGAAQGTDGQVWS